MHCPSPLVSSDPKNKAARTRSKRGDLRQCIAERHRRQPRYLGAGGHLKTGGFASPPSSGFAFTTRPVNCFFSHPSNVAKARQRKVPRGVFRRRLQQHGEFAATACISISNRELRTDSDEELFRPYASAPARMHFIDICRCAEIFLTNMSDLPPNKIDEMRYRCNI